MDKNEAWAYLKSLRYIPCRDQFYLPSTPKKVVVIHEMVAPERSDMAESLGNYFRDPRNPDGSARYASTHFGVDNDSAVRYAEFYYKVYGTDNYGNTNGWHIEQAGMGAQSPEEWFDPYSKKMMDEQTAKLTAALCIVDDIPIRHLTVDELRRGERGIATHYEMCQAFMQGQQRYWHYDPKNFPMGYFIDQVKRHAGTGKDWFDMATKEELQVIVAKEVDRAIAQLGTYEQDTRNFISALLVQHLGNFVGVGNKAIRKLNEQMFNGIAALVHKSGADTDQPLPPTKVMG